MPQNPFAFEFECEQSNDLWPNYHLAVQKCLARHFKIKKNICIFECEWLNGNSNDLCMAEFPFGRSNSNSNANGN